MDEIIINAISVFFIFYKNLFSRTGSIILQVL